MLISLSCLEQVDVELVLSDQLLEAIKVYPKIDLLSP